MTLPNSGAISIRNISDEFGGDVTPKLSDYYKGGKYVSAYANAPNVPTSGKLSLSNFYGATALDGSWLTLPEVEYTAVPGLLALPDGWRRRRVAGVDTLDGATISAPPPSGIDDTSNVHTLAVDIRMTSDFVNDPNRLLHFVVASRHPGREYLVPGDNKSGAVIGGAIFQNGYYGIEGIEIGDYSSSTNNTFPWVWNDVLSPNVWWRVVIITYYASWGSSMKALLYDQTGTKKVDTNFYGVAPGTTVFSKASRDHYVVLAIMSNGPQTAAFTFKNVRSYWSATTAGIPINP